MKKGKILKTVATLGIVLVSTLSSVFTFGGCTKKTPEPTPNPNPPIVNPVDPEKPDPEKPDPDKPNPDKPNPDQPDLEKEMSKAIDKADDFYRTLLNKNFTITTKVDGKTEVQKLQGDLRDMRAEIENSNGKSFIYVEQGNTYQISFKDGEWQKDFSDALNAIELADAVIDVWKNIEWKTYNLESKRLDGFTADDRNVILSLDEVSAVAHFYIDFEGDRSGEWIIENANKTQVEFPENVKDNTIEQPPVGPIDPVEDEYIYENGKWNINLLAENLESWIKESGYLVKLASGFGTSRDFDKLVYVNADATGVNFGAMVREDGIKMFRDYVFFDQTFKDLTQKEKISKEDFAKIMNESNQGYPINFGKTFTKCDYSLFDATAEQKTQFEKMTENIFERLVNVGYQGGSINNEGTKMPEFANAKVLFGFKTPNSTTSAGADLGNIQAWHNHYIIENNGKLEFVEMVIYGREDGGHGNSIDKVVNNVDKTWMIGIVKKTELNKENLKLFKKASKVVEKNMEL